MATGKEGIADLDKEELGVRFATSAAPPPAKRRPLNFSPNEETGLTGGRIGRDRGTTDDGAGGRCRMASIAQSHM